MESNVFLLVIFAAILHAIWNGMVKNFGDKVLGGGWILKTENNYLST